MVKHDALFWKTATTVMLDGGKVHYVNGRVKMSPTTPIPALCTSGVILPSDSDVINSKISPDVQRPGVVSLDVWKCGMY